MTLYAAVVAGWSALGWTFASLMGWIAACLSISMLEIQEGSTKVRTVVAATTAAAAHSVAGFHHVLGMCV